MTEALLTQGLVTFHWMAKARLSAHTNYLISIFKEQDRQKSLPVDRVADYTRLPRGVNN
jgi:hypothetical protein